jgi:hypothetical protein
VEQTVRKEIEQGIQQGYLSVEQATSAVAGDVKQMKACG